MLPDTRISCGVCGKIQPLKLEPIRGGHDLTCEACGLVIATTFSSRRKGGWQGVRKPGRPHPVVRRGKPGRKAGAMSVVGTAAM